MDVVVFEHENPAFEAALDIRERVFVDEQEVPYDREVDGRDPEATHFLGRVDGEPTAVARLREYEETAVKVERVAVVAAKRGEGYGDELMDVVETHASEAGYDRVVLDAQVPVVDFYKRRGYALQDDEPFEDAGIPHRRMAKPV
ncbi:GNAT family N-acetyltransferase [Halosegnis sp.]|uniref:GNAT family N-acetyltransferase n=1 Tax=Halosegnis sp. TaxID=2864959 RepID=UPI0035D4CA73